MNYEWAFPWKIYFQFDRNGIILFTARMNFTSSEFAVDKVTGNFFHMSIKRLENLVFGFSQ